MADIHEFPEPVHLSKEECAVIVNLIIRFDGNLTLARSQFNHHWKKMISLRVFKQIASKYAKEIDEKSKELAAAGKLSRFARRDFLFTALDTVYTMAMEPHYVTSYKDAGGSTEIINGAELKVALGCISLGNKMITDVEKLALRKAPEGEQEPPSGNEEDDSDDDGGLADWGQS